MSNKDEAEKKPTKNPNQPELAKHDASILDLAFVMDCTGSMGSYIQNATESIRKIVEEIVSLEKSDIKLALVEYRDHPPQDTTFVVRVNDFTESVKEMKGWLEQCSAQGGGDGPEAVADGLQAALKLTWREKSTKICVLISDAPPHGLGDPGDGFPNGCPDGIDPLEVVTKMAQKAITLYSVGCEPAILQYKEFFSALAYKTGGQYVPLRNANLLAKVIVGGAVEEISLEKLVEEAQEEIQIQQARGVTDEKVLAECVQTKLKSKGTRTNQIMLNDSALETASESAVKYSKVSNMSDLKKVYAPSAASGAHAYPHMEAFSLSSYDRSMHPPPPMAMFSMAHPMPMAATSSISAPAAAADTYSIAKEEISYGQSERLVQKALNRSKH